MNTHSKQTVILGGGFYGLRIALFLYEELGVKDIIIFEKEKDTMTRASYVNQARVHNGYHYPRSILTANRSAVNFPHFIAEYKEAIVSDFDKFYAIARHSSKVNTRQFVRFCEKIGIELKESSEEIKKHFNDSLVENVYKVQEYAFDSHILRDVLLKRIATCPGIQLRTGETVQKISLSPSLSVDTEVATYPAEYILNCTYSNINTLHRQSHIPLVKLKHEIAEMCIVTLPAPLKDFSITMMDGPFFSIMPFPTKNSFTLSHVRYTPHESWVDDETTEPSHTDTHSYLSRLQVSSHYQQMYNDVVRYIPALKDMQYSESIYEVKTVLARSENDDSRPILFRSDLGHPAYACIMGGKLDNIYDVFEELIQFYGAKT